MSNAFEILAGFLEKFEAEVEGRQCEPPPGELRQKFKQFAQGALDPGERNTLVDVLKQHPEWVSELAQEAKALRALRGP